MHMSTVIVSLITVYTLVLCIIIIMDNDYHFIFGSLLNFRNFASSKVHIAIVIAHHSKFTSTISHAE